MGSSDKTDCTQIADDIGWSSFRYMCNTTIKDYMSLLKVENALNCQKPELKFEVELI